MGYLKERSFPFNTYPGSRDIYRRLNLYQFDFDYSYSGLLSPTAKSVALIAASRFKIISKCAVNGKRSIIMEFPVREEAGFYFPNDI